MKTIRKKCSLEFKQKAGEQVKNGQHIAQISRQCDVAVSTIRRWVKEDREGVLSVSFPPSRSRYPMDLLSPRSLQGEIDDLKRLLGNRKLKISRLREKTGGNEKKRYTMELKKKIVKKALHNGTVYEVDRNYGLIPRTGTVRSFCTEPPYVKKPAPVRRRVLFV
ncbi:transposase [Pasteuria penetrans]|uniref:transposase n=1 Tax=Pasteuria penetrans TaxID=86005 RepID=UPI000FA54392|nr:transposase [Pasteuria penetrans]